MSASGKQPIRGLATRIAQLVALGVVLAVLFLAARIAPASGDALGVIGAVGVLLLAGMLASDLLEVIGLPHLTGYILAGVVAGPHVLHFIGHDEVEGLQPVNTLALALIALAGGLELRIELLKSCMRSLAWATLVHSLLGMLAMTAIVMALSPMLPFARGLPLGALVGVSLLWGVLAVSRSPSATLGILAQVRPDGPITRFSLAFVMSSDVVVVVLMTLAITLVRPLIEPSMGISLHSLEELGSELVGSLSLGTTLGLVLAAYLRLVGGHLLIPLLALSFGLTEGLRYLHFDPLLTFLTAGFVVENLTEQGKKLLHAVEQTGSVVFVVFFATAGAHLDLPLLRTLWPAALALCASRAAVSIAAHRFAAKLAKDEPVVARWGWASLISQAGLTLGLSLVIVRAYPSLGSEFRALAIATVAINELVGPVLFKLTLDRTGESHRARPSIPPPPSMPPPP